MKVNEIFESIQGEGKYAGYPVLFIRLSGCSRACPFCDTKYHEEGKNMTVKEVIKIIKKYNPDIVVWTGGEPMLQVKEIKKIIDKISETLGVHHHLETNGDIIPPLGLFIYICFSPKSEVAANNVENFRTSLNIHSDIKVVTDLEINKALIPYATMLMPLTTGINDNAIREKVWKYCCRHKLKYSPRLHYEVWGKKRGI